MAREPVQKDIDGVKYTFGRHMPKNSLKLFNRLMKIIAPTVSSGIEKKSINDLIFDGLGSADINIDLACGINALCSRMDEPEVEAIFNIILGEVIHNGNGAQNGLGSCRDNFNAIFMDVGIAHVYKVVFTALSVEYDNFFGKGVNLDAIIKQAKDLIPEKQTSTGSSGGR